MTIRNALRQELVDNAAVTALVGSKVRPGIADTDDALPYLVYSKDRNDHTRHQTASSGRALARFTITATDTTAEKADALYDVVRLALDTFTGTLGSGGNTAADVRITLADDNEGFEEPDAGTEVKKFFVIMDFLVWYKEVVPTFP